jgi:ribosomal protein S24E
VKYADDFVLLAKGEALLYDVIDRLPEIERCYRMERTVEKAKVLRISRQQSSQQNIIGQMKPDIV